MSIFPRQAHFQDAMSKHTDSMLSTVLGVFGAHAAMKMQHPENDGSPEFADGLPLEDQYGAVHTAKNDDPASHWKPGHPGFDSAAASNGQLQADAKKKYADQGIDPDDRDVRTSGM